MAEPVTDALYIKCPLPPEPGHIRLLRLHPSLDHSAPLTGTIFATTFEASRASYEALSYCWGDDARPETITLHVGNEEPHAAQFRPEQDDIFIQLPITRSLAEALADVRLTSCDRLLWADALCIDQAHNGEKSIQVRQMYDVYANSRLTLVYLGRDDAEGMQAAIAHRDYLRAVNADSDKWAGSLEATDAGTLVTWDPAVGVVRAGKGSRSTVPGEPDCLDYRTVATLPDTTGDLLFAHQPAILNSWKCILERPWTTRAWTTQEFVAGPDVLMQLGQGEVSLTLGDLSNLAQNMPYISYNFKYMGGSKHYSPLTDSDTISSKVFRMILHRSRMVHLCPGAQMEGNSKVRIGRVLFLITGFSHVDVLETRDARDIFWSLLALSQDSAVPELQPNYDLSIDEVYRRFSIHIAMMEFGSLLLLPLQKQAGPPSWRLARTVYLHDDGRLYHEQTSNCKWIPVTTNAQGTELTIPGILVDRIGRLAEGTSGVDARQTAARPYTFLVARLMSITTAYNNLQEAASWPGVFTLPGESPGEAAFKLLRGITPRVPVDISDRMNISCQAAFNADWDQFGHLYFVAQLSRDLEDDLDPTNFDFFKLIRSKGWPMDMVRYYLPPDAVEPPRFPAPGDLTTRAVCHRAFYMFFDTALAHSIGDHSECWRRKTVGMTSRGHLCNLDEEARVGDWIAVTANSKFPMILREGHDGAYSLVGKAYAHGLLEGIEMHGDVEEEIRLC